MNPALRRGAHAPYHMQQSLSDIGRRLESRTPRLVEDPNEVRAAVAAVLRDGGAGVELLLIERARKAGDPWSGHLGFPGGKVEERDVGERHTAERETREELGLDLTGAEYMGRLDDLTGATLPVLVSGFAYHPVEEVAFALSDEVVDAFWQPMGTLVDRRNHRTHHFRYRYQEHEHDVIDLGAGRPLLWGLTYRFTVQLLGIAEAGGTGSELETSS